MYYIRGDKTKRKKTMSKTYRAYEPEQMYLMPPSLAQWLPSDHMVYFIENIVDTINIKPITRVYEEEERGYPPYHPKVMIGILIYGYCSGIMSSRKLSKHCQEDIAFRVLAANNQPDFRTISDFRKRHLSALQHLFVEILQLCKEAGLIKFGHIALDGTKIRANASKHKAMSYGRMKKDIDRLKQEIAQLLKDAEKTDDREDRRYGQDKRGDELPEELARRETRLARIEEAKRALEKEASEQKQGEKKGSSDKRMPMAKVKTKKNEKTGKMEPSDDAQKNFTDAESRIMPSQKTFVQGYNAQVAVDSAHQIIVSTDVSNNPTDDPLLPALVAQLPQKPDVLSADAGYSVTDNNIKYLESKGIEAYIAIKREKHHKAKAQRGPIPKDLSIKKRMARKLQTKAGKKHYSRRKCIVEPVFGQIKHAQGFRQFSLRGHFKVRSEWFLVAASHNIRKLFKACLERPKRRSLIFAT